MTAVEQSGSHPQLAAVQESRKLETTLPNDIVGDRDLVTGRGRSMGDGALSRLICAYLGRPVVLMIERPISGRSAVPGPGGRRSLEPMWVRS